ncbi:LytR/AlgR family response regulator transcription factor [Hugenholtzia roseola]|uniref:LytR/AlgR family response regulator transcription factor n=1 Tax=Hugenholtzia roseola TaxID=1002 RepID=UPI0005510B70|nr:LytTR family DNA-binding domain-containing protein [Hugenholtzia roseola]
MLLKVLIVDDEAQARLMMRHILSSPELEVEIVGEAQDLPQAIRLIREKEPQVVFLDIEMPKYSGLQILDFFSPEEVNFEIIFATAYNNFALKAFEVSAIDYLLKPIEIEAVEKSLEKVRKRLSPKKSDTTLLAQNAEVEPIFEKKLQERLEILQSQIRKENDSNKIALPVAEGLLFVENSEIIYLHAEGSYTTVFLKQKPELVISKNIKFFENILAPHKNFLRIHRSYLVNLDAVRQYVKKDGGYLVMENGNHVSVGKDKKDEFLKYYAE